MLLTIWWDSRAVFWNLRVLYCTESPFDAEIWASVIHSSKGVKHRKLYFMRVLSVIADDVWCREIRCLIF